MNVNSQIDGTLCIALVRSRAHNGSVSMLRNACNDEGRTYERIACMESRRTFDETNVCVMHYLAATACELVGMKAINRLNNIRFEHCSIKNTIL